ncbi:hypothetical protein K438DRAFT_1761512 [Mycena galopus ATCC 62051]|nr:hypothetical protein K438DRAFT_1761512 [Mycena galopus ATCC 62051]
MQRWWLRGRMGVWRKVVPLHDGRRRHGEGENETVAVGPLLGAGGNRIHPAHHLSFRRSRDERMVKFRQAGLEAVARFLPTLRPRRPSPVVLGRWSRVLFLHARNAGCAGAGATGGIPESRRGARRHWIKDLYRHDPSQSGACRSTRQIVSRLDAARDSTAVYTRLMHSAVDIRYQRPSCDPVFLSFLLGGVGMGTRMERVLALRAGQWMRTQDLHFVLCIPRCRSGCPSRGCRACAGGSRARSNGERREEGEGNISTSLFSLSPPQPPGPIDKEKPEKRKAYSTVGTPADAKSSGVRGKRRSVTRRSRFYQLATALTCSRHPRHRGVCGGVSTLVERRRVERERGSTEAEKQGFDERVAERKASTSVHNMTATVHI